MRESILMAGCLALACCAPAAAQTLTAASVHEHSALPLVRLPRWGVDQFWSDELSLRNWRIQRSALHDDYRLVDPGDRQHARGSFPECRAALAKIEVDQGLAPPRGKAVLLLHGLGRTRSHMESLARYLSEQAKYESINVGYASTRRSLDEHAQSLARLIDNLPETTELHFVCHSLGNLVVRRYLGESAQPQPRWQIDRRLGRMVMLGPPNQGARLAEIFRNNDLLGLVAGPSGKQLGRTWDQTEPLLATPHFPFGVLAGGLGNARGASPLLDGDDDFVVSVAETMLPGAADFRLVPCLHGALTANQQAQQFVLHFLEHGAFGPETERQPIPREDGAEAAAAPSAPSASERLP